MKYTIFLAFVILFGIFGTSFSAPIIEENGEITEEVMEKASEQLEEGIATSEWKKACLAKLDDMQQKVKEGIDTVKELSEMLANFVSDFSVKAGVIKDQILKNMVDVKEKFKDLLTKS